MTIGQFFTIFFTAILTAGFTNLFGYLKEKRVASSKYTETVFKDLYLPIYKIIYSRVNPYDGFEGLEEEDIDELIKVLENNPELFDPKLQKILYRFYEKSYINWKFNEHESFSKDEKELIEYMEIAFNKTRKALGLPYDRKYAYPILLKLMIWKNDFKNARKIKRKIEKYKKEQNLDY